MVEEHELRSGPNSVTSERQLDQTVRRLKVDDPPQPALAGVRRHPALHDSTRVGTTVEQEVGDSDAGKPPPGEGTVDPTSGQW